VQGSMVTASLHGHRFVRLYLVRPDTADALVEPVRAGFEYVFAYSLHDLGDIPGFVRQRKWTQLLRLDRPPDELLASLKKNSRYEVKRTYRDEDVKMVPDDPDRDGSYRFYKDVKEADGVVPDIAEDFTSVRWINAYQGERLIVSTCWFDSGDVLRAKHIVSTRKQDAGNAALIGRITRRLFWEACLLGLDNGHPYVDLGGLDPDDPTKQGVTAFKQSFGGETVQIFVYRYATPYWRELSQRELTAGRMVV
jgi:hypothetical protein